MHTVDLVEQALALLGQLGYAVRQEALAGNGGGACELKGRKIFFLDLDLGPDERLEQVIAALRREPAVNRLPMPVELQRMLVV